MGIRLITGASYVAVLAIFYLLKIFVSDLFFDGLIWLFSLIGTFEMLRAFGALGNKEKLKDGSETNAETLASPTKAQAAGAMIFAAVCVPACAVFEEFYGSGARAAGALTQTSALRGCMRTEAKTRNEVMLLLAK